ncbi:MAG TPA: translocation/assembly module TamB domain-containing protein, partial [Candidatus Obscuribacterales bacterium]
IAGPLDNLQGVVSWDAPAGTYPTRGTAEVAANTVRVRNAELAGGTVSGVGTLVADQWTADVVAQGLQLGVFNADLQGIVGGGDVQLAGSTADFSLQGIRGNGAITAALRGGTLNSQVALANGNWEADIQTRAFPVRQFAPNLPIDTVNADARLAGTVTDFSLASLRGDGTVDAAIASGTVTSDFTLANGTWQANGQGSNLQLGQLSPDLQGVGEATFQLAGNLDNLTPAGIQGRANVRLSDGLATLAAVNPALGRMRSPLTSRLAWNGQQLQIEQLETAGLFASGTVTPLLSGPTAPGIAAIDLGITADNYALASLPLSLPPVLGLAGEADFRGRLTGTPSNLNFAGDLALANLALNDLVFDPLLTGAVDFSSQAGLTVALLGPPVTAGPRDEITVAFQPQPRQLDFTVRAGEAIATGTTEGDLLIATLEQFPISVLNLPPSDSPYGSLRGQVTSANATINLTNLNTVGRFDVANLGIGYYSVAGLSGGFAYAGGTARLTEGQIVMVDRNARGEAIGDRRLYDLSGRYSFNQTPQLQATLATDQGELRDIFEVLKIRELADLRRGFTPNDGFIPDSEAEAEAILATTPAGDPNGTLLNQLRRLSEIAELDIQEELATEQATLPPLSELQGAFQGEVEVTATLPRDLQVAFDLTGQGWEWGADLQADTVVAQGTYDNGLVSLAPLQFSAQAQAPATTAAAPAEPAPDAPATLSFVGDFSLDPADQTDYLMTIQAVNLPINKVENIANLPFTAGGRLNSTARLRGKLSDPNLTGELQVIDGSLNGSPIEAASATFSYAEARAGLDAQLLLLGSDDPLTLSAEVPYQLAFVADPPSDLSYRLNANVRDEGFALLNLFTRQIAWESGEGEIILNLEGDLANSNTLFTQFDGLIFLRGATISARALPVPMTDVTGQIRLVPTNPAIVVERLTGRFSEGELSAQGAFPLFVPLSSRASESAADPAPEAENPAADPDPLPAPSNVATLSTVPLTLDLTNIALQLQGLYSGQVNGRMQLGGSVVLGPALSGAIDLSNGTITIPERANGAAAPAAAASRGNGRFIQPFRFADLRILLGRNINIVQGNLLNVTARGGLRIDGPLDSLQPTGTIQLPSGRVGLYSVALRLAGRNDRAEFRGDFDPLLDVTLQTAVPDVAAAAAGIEQTTGPFPRNEVVDSALNVIGLTQQGNSLVRINARYTGPASELANLTTDSRNLELSSSPPRSNQEIISLLSGNVIGALGALEDGDSAIAGLGTFLGSALLSSVRDFLGDTVPISEFRLFQVSESSGGVNDSEDIGGEIGFDITSNISVSVLKVLTNDTPFQFNTRYRLSDEFTLRGTTSYEDFSDRTGVLLEYETRF